VRDPPFAHTALPSGQHATTTIFEARIAAQLCTRHALCGFCPESSCTFYSRPLHPSNAPLRAPEPLASTRARRSCRAKSTARLTFQGCAAQGTVSCGRPQAVLRRYRLRAAASSTSSGFAASRRFRRARPRRYALNIGTKPSACVRFHTSSVRGLVVAAGLARYTDDRRKPASVPRLRTVT
jgi:hypothetical protein